MNKQIKVMRGISGSGKSTYAKKLVETSPETSLICSADNFFIGPEGYKFNINLLAEAHKTCMRSFLAALREGTNLVIVDNTNIAVEDFSPYIAVGLAFNYDVEIIQLDTPPEVAAGRNLHGVRENQVQGMYKRLCNTKVPNRFKTTHINSQEE